MEFEARISALETDVKNIKEKDISQDKRIEKHGIEIDAIARGQNDFKVEIEILKKSMSLTEENTREIKTDVKSIIKQREADHLTGPLESSKKIFWQLIALLVTFIFGVLIKTLFPTI